MANKIVTVNGMLKDINDNFDWLEAARVGGVSQVMAEPEGEETTSPITARSGLVLVPDDGGDPAGALGLTLLDPVAVVDDGKVLTIVSVAAQACTVTLSGPDDEAGDPTASAGFNSDATKNLATFGGAIGDNLTLLAYNGEWLVLNSVNITLGTAT
ncbi:MAG TPA: hypothetical protein VFF68_03065 [Anaerolineaceae bacterium]|nr:hypothetical protein [Anaerolineaceae bacterium]